LRIGLSFKFTTNNKRITEIIMALGDLLFEEKGKQLSARTVDSIEPTAGMSGMGSLK
jgi:hypothetical protein